jgi:hypothetical protein
MAVFQVGEVGNEVGGPADAAMAQPGVEESVRAMLGDDAGDGV